MRAHRLVAATAVTAAFAAMLAVGSGLSWPHHSDPSGVLRLSWSARPERIETCVAQTPEQLAKLEPHMRRRLICEGAAASYALRVEVDGILRDDAVVRGGGLRNDRSLYLLRDYFLPVGEHHVRVSMIRRESPDAVTPLMEGALAEEDTGLFAGRAAREIAERMRRRQAAIPPILVMDTTVVLSARQVVVVTFAADRRVLELLVR